MSNYLTVPMRVDGLWLSQGVSALSALAEFGTLPYRDDHPTDAGFRQQAKPDTPQDFFSDIGWISENFVSQPFNDQNFWLPTGVHLHWALPSALTHMTSIPDGSGSYQNHLPAVPNRWLISRTGGGLSTKSWVVESDYLWPKDSVIPSGHMPPINYPLPNVAEGSPPTQLMGRVIPITSTGYTPAAPTNYLSTDHPLTAVGYGDPHFHAFYPNCYSVFGFWDNEITQAPSADLVYTVVGWYSEQTNDLFWQWVNNQFSSLNVDDIRQWVGLAPADSGDGTGASRPTNNSDYVTAFVNKMQHDLGWTMNTATLTYQGTGNEVWSSGATSAWDGMACVGQLTLNHEGWTKTPGHPPNGDITVSIGNTGTEALSALLATQLAAGDMTKKDQYENQLEALTVAAKLADQQVDIGPKFEQARHSKTFGSTQGGSLWSLRNPPPADAQKQNQAAAGGTDDVPSDIIGSVANFTIQLDYTLAASLEELNNFQQTYDRGERVIRQMRQHVYAAWYKYMKSAYHPADVANNYPDPDEVRSLVEKMVAQLDMVRMFVGELTAENGTSLDPNNPPQATASQPTIDWSAMQGSAIASLAIDLYEAVNGDGALSPNNVFDVNNLFAQRHQVQTAFASWLFGFMGLSEATLNSMSAPNLQSPFPLNLSPTDGIFANQYLPAEVWEWLQQTVIPANIDLTSWYPGQTLRGITFKDPGLGYSDSTQINLTSDSGSGGTAIAVAENGALTTAKITSPGQNYLSPPAVDIFDGNGARVIPIVNSSNKIEEYITLEQGQGYGANPTVTVTGKNGSGATAIATSGTGQLIDVFVTNGGLGYATPTVAITGTGEQGAGTGAKLQPIVNSDGALISIEVLDGGSNYSNGTKVIITENGTHAVDGSLSVQDGVIQAIPVSSSLTSSTKGFYTPSPKVEITGSGSGANAFAVINASTSQIDQIAVAAQGNNYQSPPDIQITGGQLVINPTAAVSNGEITGITGGSSGSYFTTQTYTINGYNNEGATPQLQAVINGEGMINSVQVISGGSGYYGSTMQIAESSGNGVASATYTYDEKTGAITSVAVIESNNLFTPSPIVTITGDGANAQACAVITGSTISGYHIINKGSGYTSATASVTTISATAEAMIANEGQILTVTPQSTHYGSGYNAPPAFTISPTNGTSFLPLVDSDGSVTDILIRNGGSGFPTLTLTSVDTLPGSGATASLLINGDGTLQDIIVTNGGQGYEAAPTVSINGLSISVKPSFNATVDSNGAVTSISTITADPANTIYIEAISPPSGVTIDTITVDATGTITDVTLSDGGSGFSPTPTVSIGGSGATATAVVLTEGQKLFTSIATLTASHITQLSAITNQIGAWLTNIQVEANADTPNFLGIIEALKELATDRALASISIVIDALVQALENVRNLPDSAAKIATQKQVCRYLLANITHYQLHTIAAPRFWHPTEPSLLLTGNGLQHSDRHMADDAQLFCSTTSASLNSGSITDKTTNLPAHTISSSTIAGIESTLATAISSAEQAAATTLANAAHTATAAELQAATNLQMATTLSQSILERSGDGNPWHPLFFEWETGLLPIKNHGNISPTRRQYGINFLRDNFQLYGDKSEFIRLNTNSQLTGSTSNFQGRSVVTPHAPRLLTDAIKAYVLLQTQRYIQSLGTAASAKEQDLLKTPSADTQAFTDYFSDSGQRQAILDWCDQQHHIELVKLFIKDPSNIDWLADFVTRCYFASSSYKTLDYADDHALPKPATVDTPTSTEFRSAFAYKTSSVNNAKTVITWLQGTVLKNWFPGTPVPPSSLILSSNTKPTPIPAPTIAQIVKFSAMIGWVENQDAVSLTPGGQLTLTDDEDYIAFYKAYESNILYWLNSQISGQADNLSAMHLVSSAWDKLDAQADKMQSQALSGFNAALLMHHQTLQLNVADPIGLPGYREFTEMLVSTAVADQNRVAPNSSWDFQPIRVGDLEVNRLRLADNFGRVMPLKFTNLIKTRQMTRAAYTPKWASLPARLTQPARVNFRWQAADGLFSETNPHPLTNPICGWIMTNNLDGSLMVYDNQGYSLGYIDIEGIWRSPPGQIGVAQPSAISNPYLANMIHWFCEKAQTATDPSQFMNDLNAVFQTALENIDPENFRQHKSRALLMGQPIALVRAIINVELEAGPAYHHGWDPFRRRLIGHPPKTDAYTQVQVPIRLGEHEQLNDGVVGYWPEENGQFATRYTLTSSVLASLAKPPYGVPQSIITRLADLENKPCIGQARFKNQILAAIGTEATDQYFSLFLQMATAGDDLYLPQSNSSDTLSQDENLVIYQTSDKALNFYQSVDDPPQMVSLLLDPRGIAHCTTGVLPTKALTIPPEYYSKVLQNINITFLSAPVLSDPNRINVPIPRESGYEWSWWQKVGTTWQHISTTPKVQQSLLITAYGMSSGSQIWATLIQSNWVVPDPLNPGSGTLNPPEQRGVLPDPRQQIVADWLNGEAAQSASGPPFTMPGSTTIESWAATQNYSDGVALRQSLVAAGWVSIPTDGTIYINTSVIQSGAPFADTRTPDIQQVLDLGEQVLGSTTKDARIGQTQVLHEGWLSLAPDNS